jgi:hypothetical protein
MERINRASVKHRPISGDIRNSRFFHIIFEEVCIPTKPSLMLTLIKAKGPLQEWE